MMRIFVDRVMRAGAWGAEYDFVCIERVDGVVIDVTSAHVRAPFIDHYGDRHELEEPTTTVTLLRHGDTYFVHSCDGSTWAGFDRFEPWVGPIPDTATSAGSAQFALSDNAAFDDMPMYISFDEATRVVWARDQHGARVHEIAPFDFFLGSRSRGRLMTTVVNAGLVTFGLPQSDHDDALAAALLRPGQKRHELVRDPQRLRELDVERRRRMRRYADASKLQPWRSETVEPREP